MARNIAVADCETDPFRWGRVPQPFVWGYYNGERYFQFKKTKDFVEFLKHQSVICYAHNGGKFDWHFLLPELEAYTDIMIINGRIARVGIGLAELRDSYSILPIPLSAYKKDKIDYTIMEPEERRKPKNWRKITEYLKSDCIYLYELVSGFVGLYGVQITQASAAMNQWKKITTDKLPNSTKEFYETISPYYYGGRVECFESGIIDTRFSVFDINSAYPYAMLHEHPYATNYAQSDGYAPQADFYRVRCISRGAFPYRGMGNPGEFAGLRFPNDDEVREYCVTRWEYDAAVRTKTISKVKVIESLTFDGHTDFKQYIQHFYEMRLKAQAKNNAAESLFAKLLMNSLYGKFASNPENYRNYMIVPMDVIGGLEATGWHFGGEIGPWGLAEAPLNEEQKRYYNVATGASITGFVRAMLWEAICSSDGVLYCDTDSIAARSKGDLLSLGNALGQWKLEGEFDRAGIAGKKLYIFRGVKGKDGKRAYKHASKGARLTKEQLWEVAAGHEVVHYSDAPTFSASKAPNFDKLRHMSQDEINKQFFTTRRIKYTAKRERVKL